LKLFK